jgi:hypothetical protein
MREALRKRLATVRSQPPAHEGGLRRLVPGQRGRQRLQGVAVGGAVVPGHLQRAAQQQRGQGVGRVGRVGRFGWWTSMQ